MKSGQYVTLYTVHSRTRTRTHARAHIRDLIAFSVTIYMRHNCICLFSVYVFSVCELRVNAVKRGYAVSP